jgi:hypothetical protein
MLHVTETVGGQVASASSIAACSDNQGGSLSDSTDFIFYQPSDGVVTMQRASSQTGNSTNANIQFTNAQVLGQAAKGTKFRAVYNNGDLMANVGIGPILFYQAEETEQLMYMQVSRDGRVSARGVVSGNDATPSMRTL